MTNKTENVYGKITGRRFMHHLISQRDIDGLFYKADLSKFFHQNDNRAQKTDEWITIFQALELANTFNKKLIPHLASWHSEWLLTNGSSVELIRQIALRGFANSPRIPSGYYSIFDEVKDHFLTVICLGVDPSSKISIDGSVGKQWRRHWEKENLADKFGQSTKYSGIYTDHYPQSESNPHFAYAYPYSSLGDFKRWMKEFYHGAPISRYLSRQVKRGTMSPEQQRAIEIVLRA